jgi:hypothetical protein
MLSADFEVMDVVSAQRLTLPKAQNFRTRTEIRTANMKNNVKEAPTTDLESRAQRKSNLSFVDT